MERGPGDQERGQGGQEKEIICVMYMYQICIMNANIKYAKYELKISRMKVGERGI